MRKTQINPAILQPFLESAQNASAKGQAQWFTPLPWGKTLALALPQYRPLVMDLNCGAGHLITSACNTSTGRLLGLDIEPPSAECDLPWSAALSANRVTGDLTRFYPLLQAVKFEADLFVLNPPWDLHWYRDRLSPLANSGCLAVRNAFEAHDGRTSEDTIDSTVATLCIALDLCSHVGEGMLIANESTLQRLIFGPKAPHGMLAAHVWHHLVIEGNICEKDGGSGASRFQTGIIYFARSHTTGPGQSAGGRTAKCCANLAEAERHCRELQQQRMELRHGPEIKPFQRSEDPHTLWKAAADEWNVVSGQKPPSQWNLWLDVDGTIRTDLSLYDQRSERIPKQESARLFKLNGRHPMSLVMQVTERRELQRATFDGIWRVAPAVTDAVKLALDEYTRVRSPLTPLSKIQRLGYLDENEDILCEKDLGAGGKVVFKAGERYKIRTETIRVQRNGEKMNLQGCLDVVEWEGAELAIFIMDHEGIEHLFMEGKLRAETVTLSIQQEGETAADKINFTLQELVAHFQIPEVPDVAAARAEEYKQFLAMLDDIERIANTPAGATRFKFKNFQREDYARAALHNGVILGHDTGGGKGLALYVIPALKVGFDRNLDALVPNEAVLLVAPEDLHQQVIQEGQDKFHATVTVLDKKKFLALATVNPRTARYELAPGYYLTSYTDLAGNGVTPFPKFDRKNIRGIMEQLGLNESCAVDFFNRKGKLFKRNYERLNVDPELCAAELHSAWQTARDLYETPSYKQEVDNDYDILRHFATPQYGGLFHDLEDEQQGYVLDFAVRHLHIQCQQTIGQVKYLKGNGGRTARCKCLFDPSFSDLAQDTFASVAVDEGVKMKGEETIIGQGVRQMASRYKLVLTATPIKNRLPDVFRLAWWATGGREDAHARFPYPDSSEAREEFATEFMISERNLTKEDDTNRRYLKLTPQVCNVHRLWKMFSPIILRRGKKDFGEDIVRKFRHIVRVPLGTHQAAAYKFHLDAKYTDYKGRPAIGAQLQALRVCAANPASHLLVRPERDHRTEGEPRSRFGYIPKLVSALKLVHQILERGEQVVVFSAFHDSLDALSAHLTESGVRHCTLDGRMTPKKRGAIAAQFKLGPPKAFAQGQMGAACQPSTFPVMLAGVGCMAEGHSFHLCNNVILMCYDWAYDKFEQAINRVHRLNSRWDVNVYPIICEGSIDRKLEANIHEKGDAAGLVLDGELIEENQAEMNLAELLHIARIDFNAGGTPQGAINEEDLVKGWPQLRAQLGQAMRSWRRAAFIESDIIAPTEFKLVAPQPSIASSAPRSTAFDDMPLWKQMIQPARAVA